MLAETAYRRKGFDEEHSVPVRLSDGKEWFFPKPWLALRPIFQDGKPVDLTGFFSQGPELDSLIEAIASAESPWAKILAGMALAGMMLLRNYDLGDDELAEILVYQQGDSASGEMLAAIISVATGQTGKKPSPAGGGSA